MLVVTQAFHPKVLLLLHGAQTAAWLLALIAGAVGGLMLWPVAAAVRRIPRGTLIDLVESVLGRWGAAITAVLFLAALCFAGGMVLREASEMTISAVFPHTPQTFATTALLIGALYVAWGNGSALVRMGHLLLPMLLTAVAVVLAGTMGWGEFRYLLPFWGPGLPTILGNIPAAAAIQFPVIVLLTLTGEVNDRAGLVRWLVAVPLLGGLIMALINVVLQIVFAFPIGLNIPFPLHTASRLILGGRFFERLEGIWVFIWVTATILLLGAMLFATSHLFARAFRMPRRQTVILPAATVILTVAFFPTDQAETIEWHLGSTPALFWLLFAYPTALALFSLLRQRRKTG